MVMCAIANTDDVVVAAPAAVVLADAVVAVAKELILSLQNCNAGKN
jgi:hypothetical protein